MSQTLEARVRSRRLPGATPEVALDAAAIRDAYRRWSSIYDVAFGGVSSFARKRAAVVVNRLPGRTVLEVGVGTGLALPRYAPEKRIVGIDLSADMLALARRRVAKHGLRNVEGLLEMDAEATEFADGQFDTAVAMFVASVVPNPRRMLAELRRVVRPGGTILLVNHFAAEGGPRWWVERAMAPASRRLGWHPDFAMRALFESEEIAGIDRGPMPPFGIFTRVRLRN
ncbi:MAG TPA: class I SAM-dependent methyltransferase [Acetobacteraceae bacterium]|jgi:phosphatidylethanolamine/phosphatidyl-N-methylethanolamine N-methyltransferase|nr:class I SAM-dependent methyltransferase [Acetobacteraceae bacterium]